MNRIWCSSCGQRTGNWDSMESYSLSTPSLPFNPQNSVPRFQECWTPKVQQETCLVHGTKGKVEFYVTWKLCEQSRSIETWISIWNDLRDFGWSRDDPSTRTGTVSVHWVNAPFFNAVSKITHDSSKCLRRASSIACPHWDRMHAIRKDLGQTMMRPVFLQEAD